MKGTRARLTGFARTRAQYKLRRGYADGQSIRELADEHGMSYGLVYALLQEAGVQMRSRGAPAVAR